MMEEEYHGHYALRAYKHYCPDSDYQLISENDLEFQVCNCFMRDSYLLFSDKRLWDVEKEEPKTLIETVNEYYIFYVIVGLAIIGLLSYAVYYYYTT